MMSSYSSPEDLGLLGPDVPHVNACCGAATAYLLRRIAYRAGAYAPGIQELIFHELNTSREGGTIEKVQRWFNSRSQIARTSSAIACSAAASRCRPPRCSSG